MGLKNLRERFNDPYMAEVFQGMFPTDNPRNTRFAINFFTAIGLGGLTDGLRLHLKNAPKMIMEAQVRHSRSGPAVLSRTTYYFFCFLMASIFTSLLRTYPALFCACPMLVVVPTRCSIFRCLPRRDDPLLMLL